MRKKKNLILLLVLMLCYSLFQTTAGAESSSLVTISFQGIIAHSPSNNLAVLPEFFNTGWGIGESSIYPTTWAGKDNTIEMRWNPLRAQNPSMNAIGELDGKWLPINVGDRIVFSAWLYAEDGTTNDTSTYRGARIEIDFYSNGLRLVEIGGSEGQPSWIPSQGNNGWADLSPCVAQRGTNIWKFAKIDFIVQQEYESDGWGGYPRTQKHTPDYFTAIVVNGAPSQYVPTERGRVWIWNPELYVNPTIITPTPTPSPTPYPTSPP